MLHAFQKKSKQGIATPQAEIELIKRCLKQAEQLHKACSENRRCRKTMKKVNYVRSSGNVFADLELPDAEEWLLKAQLAVQIRRFIEQKDWTQAETAEIIGLDQPKVSNLLRGRLAGFSVDRLLSILNRLGHNVEVRISAKEYDPDEAQTLVTVT